MTPPSNRLSDDVTVFVSKSSFCMVPSLYRKVEKLPWRQRSDGNLYLNANADVFEILLQFLMFNKLPGTTDMTKRQARQLEKMIRPLDDVATLADHANIFIQGDKELKSPTKKILRRLFKELQATIPRRSQYVPGGEIPERNLAVTRSPLSLSFALVMAC